MIDFWRHLGGNSSGAIRILAVRSFLRAATDGSDAGLGRRSKKPLSKKSDTGASFQVLLEIGGRGRVGEANRGS